MKNIFFLNLLSWFWIFFFFKNYRNFPKLFFAFHYLKNWTKVVWVTIFFFFLDFVKIWQSNCRPKSKIASPDFGYVIGFGIIQIVTPKLFSGNIGQTVFWFFFWFLTRPIFRQKFLNSNFFFPSKFYLIQGLLTALIQFFSEIVF